MSTCARDRRAALYFADQDWFFTMLRSELWQLQAEARQLGLVPSCRLNGSSDIPWAELHRDFLCEFDAIQFYDYTKVKSQMNGFLSRSTSNSSWPTNYHLTLSADASQRSVATQYLQSGGNVALVFSPELPSSWWGYPVLDGDQSDARFLDPTGTIVGLRAKGRAQVDTDHFVIRPCPNCGPVGPEMQLTGFDTTTQHSLTHACLRCGHHVVSKWTLRGSNEQPDPSSNPIVSPAVIC
ncbi:MAG: hypothetical protein KDB23_07035 [Planctomycetales bacterium]|nr:hypothetical protein [Planctomycetales bacterium]